MKKKQNKTGKSKTFCLFKVVVKSFKCLCFQCTPHRENITNITKKKGREKTNQLKTQGDLKFKKKEKGNNNLSSKKDSKSLRVSVSF